jgi:hypothetical protein
MRAFCKQPFGACGGAVRHDHGADALAPGAPGAAAAVQQRFGIGRQVGMDDQIEIGQIDAAGRDVGGDADRARPSRIACSAWVRSLWLSSPDSATTESRGC